MIGWLMLIPFAAICYVQNMAFTWSSRSRQSGDPDYHRKASWASNGVYYLTNLLLTLYIVRYIKTDPWLIAASGVIYTLSTAEGSVMMMKLLIKSNLEEGLRAIGAK